MSFIFTWLWLFCIGSHGCFPVTCKSPNYSIAEAPSNPLLNLLFKKKYLAPALVIIGPQFMYAINHAYLALILVHGLNLNHNFEIIHLCEFGPMYVYMYTYEEFHRKTRYIHFGQFEIFEI